MSSNVDQELLGKYLLVLTALNNFSNGEFSRRLSKVERHMTRNASILYCNMCMQHTQADGAETKGERQLALAAKRSAVLAELARKREQAAGGTPAPRGQEPGPSSAAQERPKIRPAAAMHAEEPGAAAASGGGGKRRRLAKKGGEAEQQEQGIEDLLDDI